MALSVTAVNAGDNNLLIVHSARVEDEKTVVHVGGMVGGSVGSWAIGLVMGIISGAGGFQLSINCKKG